MATIVTRTLAGGMTFVAEPMPEVRSAAVAWLIPAGSASDPPDRLGMSTLWEELLMRGAGNLSSREHADALDRLGVSRDASIGSYHLSVSATTIGARLREALPLLVDMVRRPRMDADAIGPAKDLALQAIASLADEPQQRASEAARKRHYPSPLDRSTLGTEAGINAVTRDELIAGWRERARPGRSIFAAAGAIDPDAIAADLDRLLAGWTGATPEVAIGSTPPRGYAHEADDSNQVQVLLLHDAPPERHADSLLERTVSSVLAGGMASRLFTEVREKRGLCYAVSSGYASGREIGTVTAYVGTTPERAQQSLDVLVAELERIQSPAGRVEPDEFARAIVGMKSRLVFSGESTGARAGALAYDQHRLGRPRSLDELTSAIDALTLDRVNEYLARRTLGRVTVQTLGPAGLTPPASVA